MRVSTLEMAPLRVGFGAEDLAPKSRFMLVAGAEPLGERKGGRIEVWETLVDVEVKYVLLQRLTCYPGTKASERAGIQWSRSLKGIYS